MFNALLISLLASEKAWVHYLRSFGLLEFMLGRGLGSYACRLSGMCCVDDLWGIMNTFFFTGLSFPFQFMVGLGMGGHAL